MVDVRGTEAIYTQRKKWLIEIRSTEFKGFPFPYELRLAKILDGSIRRRNLRNRELLEIGRAVSANVKQLLNPETRNSRPWYSGLEFEVEDDVRVAILFPWKKDYDPETNKDRLIRVYSDRGLLTTIVGKLLVDMADQVYLKFPLINERVLH